MKDVYLAKMLLKLIREHKANCNDEYCGISTMAFGHLYEELVGRRLTKTEIKVFM